MIVTYFPGGEADVATNRFREVTWDELLRALSSHERRPNKEGRGFSPVAFKTSPCACQRPSCPQERGHRRADNVVGIHALGLDLDRAPDGGAFDEESAATVVRRLIGLGLAFVVYSTHSYAPPSKCNLRAFIRVSRPVLLEEWSYFWHAAVRYLDVPTGTGALHGRADQPCRFWYLPSAPEGAEVFTFSQDGEALDVDTLLATALPVGCITEPTAEPVAAPTELAEDGHVRAARAALFKLPPHVKGEQPDGHTFRAAALLRRDWALPDDQAWPLLVEWNALGKPPYPRDKLRDLFDRCVDNYANGTPGEARDLHTFGEALVPPTVPAKADVPAALVGTDKPHEKLFARFLAVALALIGGSLSFEVEYALALLDFQAAMSSTGDAAKLEPFFFPASELFQKDFPETPWLVDELITEGGLSFIAAEPKASKTWAATEVALAVSLGAPVFGKYRTRKRRVAYFYCEDMEVQVRNRIRALCAWRSTDPASVSDLFIQPRGKSFDVRRDEDVALMVASVRRFGGVGLLVMDPLSNLHSGEEDKRDSMAPVMRRLMMLGQVLRCDVLVLHHTHKDNAQGSKRRPGQKMRGSSAIHGSVDCGIYLSELDGDGENVFKTHVQSEVKGARSAGHFDLTLTITDGPDGTARHAAWQWERSSVKERDEKREKEVEEKILQEVRTLHAIGPDALVGRTNMRGRVRGADKEIISAINRLVPTRLREGRFEYRDSSGAIVRTSKSVLYLPERALEPMEPAETPSSLMTDY